MAADPGWRNQPPSPFWRHLADCFVKGSDPAALNMQSGAPDQGDQACFQHVRSAVVLMERLRHIHRILTSETAGVVKITVPVQNLQFFVQRTEIPPAPTIQFVQNVAKILQFPAQSGTKTFPTRAQTPSYQGARRPGLFDPRDTFCSASPISPCWSCFPSRGSPR